jgi:dihydrofolate reductase
MIIQIAAMSKNRVIGMNNELPWDIPEDLQFFRSTTLGKACIHGRKTFESVGHPLPYRLNVIVSRNARDLENQYNEMLGNNPVQLKKYRAGQLKPGQKPTMVLFVTDLESAFKTCEMLSDIYGPDTYVCGGAEIYKQALPQTDRILLTEIDREIDGDTYFPEFDATEFKLVQKNPRSHDDIQFSFCTYDRA